MSGSLWESSDVYLDGAPVGSVLVTTAKRRISYAANLASLPGSDALTHERGGLEADVSAYSGLVKISGGTTSQATPGTDYALPAQFTNGITADVGSAQGNGAQTIAANVKRATFVIETCANAGDCITLPAGVAGTEVVVINTGANSADVFPASGGDLGAGADTAVAVAAGGIAKWTALSATVYHPHQ